jgi:pantoate--beta-alanine ligase
MKIILNKNKLKKLIHNEKNLGFVPTMGAIHMGHSSLVKRCISECDKSIVSIFVNKPQFNKKNDYKKYPRTLKNDIFILKKLKINYLYLPSKNQIYPSGQNKNIKISSFEKKLCGKSRPGHFKAVVDVIDRFIKIMQPKRIYFGEKDMQQLKIIDHFVKKNHKDTRIIACKTIREKNGIAYSSRNLLLSLKQKAIASKIYKLIKNKKQNLIKNKSSLIEIKKKIYKLGANKIEYIQILDINKLIKPYIKNNKYKIFIAYYLGKTRLIDNI